MGKSANHSSRSLSYEAAAALTPARFSDWSAPLANSVKEPTCSLHVACYDMTVNLLF
jgi:hypothetical protein